MVLSRPAMSRGRQSSLVACCMALAAAVIAPSCFCGIRPSSMQPSPRVALQGKGPNQPEAVQNYSPKKLGLIKWMKRMPTTTFDTEEIMKRITTVLIRNMDERWRDAPMKIRTIQKEIGLRGKQIKSLRDMTPALGLLMAQKVVHQITNAPKRYEIHEEYRKFGVPPISYEAKDPWKFTHLIQFKRVKVPKYGPVRGLYRPQDREFLKSRGLPLISIYDRIVRQDPYKAYIEGDMNALSANVGKPEMPAGTYEVKRTLVFPRAPKGKDGKYILPGFTEDD